MHGKDTSLPKGTEITAYVNGDMNLDIAKFQPADSSNLPAQAAPSGPADCRFRIPEVATVTVKKAGFKAWERKLKVRSGSSVRLNAELEKVATPWLSHMSPTRLLACPP